jgi:hypothetical protein
MPRRHNTIRHGAARAEDRVLNGLLADPADPDLARAVPATVNGHPLNGYCRGGCGYLAANCGCPGSARLTPRPVATVALPDPEPEVRGCPRCRPDGCGPCGYLPANCTCPGGPRGNL